MSRVVAQQAPDNIAKPLAIADGGTGHKTAISALEALDGVPFTSIGQPSGPVPLAGNSKIPSQFIPNLQNPPVESVYGPAIAYCGVLTKYWLSDFDIGTVYNVSCVDGVVSISGNEIHYTPPATAGSYGFTINGYSFSVTAISGYIQKPIITSIANNAVVNLKRPLIVIDQPILVGLLNQTGWAYEYQLAEDNAFTTNLQTFSSAALSQQIVLETSKTYFIRARARTNETSWSEWSNVNSFNTSVYFLYLNTGVYYPPYYAPYHMGNSVSIDDLGDKIVICDDLANFQGHPGTGCYALYEKTNNVWSNTFNVSMYDVNFTPIGFGYSSAISGDGNSYFIGANTYNNNSTPNAGKVYHYRKEFDGWFDKPSLLPSHTNMGSWFGYAIAANTDGSRIIVSAPGDTVNSVDSAGSAYIFKWVIPEAGAPYLEEEARLISNNPTFAEALGQDVSINGDGTIASVSTATGKIFIFTRTGTTWSQAALINGAADTLPSDQFGYKIKLDNSGTTLIVGANRQDLGQADTNTNYGAAYIFTFDGSVWTQHSKLVPSILYPNDVFGWDVDISNDGTIVAVSSFDAEYNSTIGERTGAVYIFRKINNTWVQTQKIKATLIHYYAGLGDSIALSGDGNTLALAAPFDFQTNPVNSNGALHIFSL